MKQLPNQMSFNDILFHEELYDTIRINCLTQGVCQGKGKHNGFRGACVHYLPAKDKCSKPNCKMRESHLDPRYDLIKKI